MPCSTFWCKTQIQTFTTTWCLTLWFSSSTSSPTANTTSSGPCWMSILKRTSLQHSPTSESLWAYQKLLKSWGLTLPLLRLLLSCAQECKFFWKLSKPCHVGIHWKALLSTLRWVPICQGFGHLQGFLHHFVVAKLAISSIRVKLVWTVLWSVAYQKLFLKPPVQACAWCLYQRELICYAPLQASQSWAYQKLLLIPPNFSILYFEGSGPFEIYRNNVCDIIVSLSCISSKLMVVLKYYIDNACDIIVHLSCISSKLMVVLKYYIDNACDIIVSLSCISSKLMVVLKYYIDNACDIIVSVLYFQ